MKKLNTVFIEKSKIVNCSSKNGEQLIQFVKNNARNIDNFNLQKVSGKKFVLVVGGGMSAEREVSYMSANGIVDSLLELGHLVVFADMGADIANILHTLAPDAVFNALHGTYGEDGCLPGLLNILRIPYTGPGVLASSLAFNKKKFYEICKVNKVRVANAITLKKTDGIKTDPMPRPYVIKPLSQGSSVGVEIIFEEDDFVFADYNFEYGDEILVEQYIKGRELQIAVLNGKAMGVLEIKILPGKRFYDYEVKYTEGLAAHLMPAPIPELAYNQALKMSEEVCRIFDCDSGIIRVEMFYDEQEEIFYMLELNTHPGMTPLSLCPEIVANQGISYTELVKHILDGAKFEK